MRSLRLSLLILFFPLLATASGPSCFSLFEVSRPLYVLSEDGQFSSQLIEHINATNLHFVFSHNFMPKDTSVFGAKAVGISLPGERPSVYFFATGAGTRAWDVHHMNALDVVLRERQLPGVTNNRISSELLPYVQGYELSLERVDGRWHVSQLRIDSGITGLQVVSGVPLSLPSQQSMLAEIRRLIPKELRSFELPGFPPALQFREWMWMRPQEDSRNTY